MGGQKMPCKWHPTLTADAIFNLQCCTCVVALVFIRQESFNYKKFADADAHGNLVSDFDSKADLIDALLTSCHIPVYFAGSFVRTFRGRLAYDGGVSNFLPVPPESEYAARVCCFPSQSISLVRSLAMSNRVRTMWVGQVLLRL
jgi:hypothetical protein